MISLYSRFSSTMTAIRDAGPATVPADELATVDEAELEGGAPDDRVAAEPPPQPATDTTTSATLTIHVTQ
jgi:hypothetical protein